MIISRTPFRISLFGGGSDFPGYYKYHAGKVIGFTFNRYNYILFNPMFQKNEFKYNINYSLNEKKNQIIPGASSKKETCGGEEKEPIGRPSFFPVGRRKATRISTSHHLARPFGAALAFFCGEAFTASSSLPVSKST